MQGLGPRVGPLRRPGFEGSQGSGRGFPFWGFWGPPKPSALPVAQETYLFEEVYIETIMKEPQKGRSFRLQGSPRP